MVARGLVAGRGEDGGQRGFHVLQMLDGAADALAGQVLEGTGFEDRVEFGGDGLQGLLIRQGGSQRVADGLGGFHDLVGGGFGGLHYGFQLQAAIAAGFGGAGEHAAHFLLHLAELVGEVGFGEAEELGGGMDFGAELGDAAVQEAPEVGEGGGEFFPDDDAQGLVVAWRHRRRVGGRLGWFANGVKVGAP